MMRRVAGGVISLGLIATSTAAFAQSHSIQSALMIVFAGSGCAIGPATRAAAIQYGFSADVVASFQADMRNRDDSVLNTNAWYPLQIYQIAVAAGWYVGASRTERGVPRPPLCHYE